MVSPDPADSAVTWEDGAPRSRRHGDVYFSRDDGLAESRAVFLAGCGLPEAWRGRRRFTVGELGFGTGLNIAALLHLWRQTRGPGAQLHVFTIETDPLMAAEAARALAAWPELGSVAALMTARWPGRARGFHRIDLPELSATVDVAILEAGEALQAWNGAADAWFLDGFAPSLNPEIWRDEVIAGVARRSAPGARAATYTVAGAIRRALSAAGFAVQRAPGHGRKRERLEAHLPGESTEPAIPRVAIIGAGIAGASLVRAFRDLGAEPMVFDAGGPGSGGSGSPAGLMAPRLDAGLGPAAALFAQAARRASRLYASTPEVVIASSVLQLAVGPKDPRRFAAIADSALFEPDAMRRLTPEMSGDLVGEAAPEGLRIEEAMVVSPRAILAAWLGETRRARVASVRRSGDIWRMTGDDGTVVAEADVVCVAAAMATSQLVPGLAMTAVRGQVTYSDTVPWTQPTVFGAYVVPTRRGVLVGATHDRDDETPEAREADRLRNLAAVRAVLPALADRLAGRAVADWTAVRATTQDYLPLAGPAPGAAPGLVVLTGLGSRGLCLAPLLAEHLAAEAMGAASPLPRALAALVHPGRFAARAARKGRPRVSGPAVD